MTPRRHASTSSGAAGSTKNADVGDRVVQHDVVAGRLDGERLVEIGARRRVERDERDVGAIDVVRSPACDGRSAAMPPLGFGEHVGGELARHLELDRGSRSSPASSSVVARSDRRAAASSRQRRAPMNMPLSAS